MAADTPAIKFTADDALRFHSEGKPGKLEITPTKPLTTQRDLSLAYSPGVAVPVLAIAEDKTRAYDYTNKGNLVAVVSNGTAILGLGNLGAQASKPVMEGKGALFKRFADIDALDLLVDTQDVDAFINSVRYLGPSFGGINLEDIKAPDCFVIEERLKELLDIPVFHDDQHGTAIIAAAGLINALELTGRNISTFKLVVNGAGSAGIACLDLLVAMGMPRENILLCDTKGVIHQGRKDGMNQWKSTYAVKTKARTLDDAMKGADAFFGLSAKGAVTQAMVKSMAPKPIIFAMANPDPEITPEEIHAVRSDAIVATGRSDYPNQINNVLGFPFIFRGALDVRAREINIEMKIAAARALAELAREEVPDQVAAALYGRRPIFGPEYIIPAPFDPRLITSVPPAVARAAVESGVARTTLADSSAYVSRLRGRLDPMAGWLTATLEKARSNPKRIIFAEGEEPAVIRAANAYLNQGYGTPLMVGTSDTVKANFKELGVRLKTSSSSSIRAARHIRRSSPTTSTDACSGMVICGATVNVSCSTSVMCSPHSWSCAGMPTPWSRASRATGAACSGCAARHRSQARPRVVGVSLALCRGRAVLVADTSVTDMPTAEQVAYIAIEAARAARNFGMEPPRCHDRLLEFRPAARRTLGPDDGSRAYSGSARRRLRIRREMSADVALNPDLRRLYPFCRLTDTANVLVMPAFHAASISTKMLKELGGATVLGPILTGLSHPVQICQLGAMDNDILPVAALAACNIGA
jgi:malate dehydrogenase (oxaloacetate-decarboxylating)(NADP+)